MVTSNIAADRYTHAPQKRGLGKLNVGFHCSHCGEFVALTVKDQSGLDGFSYSSNGPVHFNCPFCSGHERRTVSELQILLLMEATNDYLVPRRNSVSDGASTRWVCLSTPASSLNTPASSALRYRAQRDGITAIRSAPQTTVHYA